MTSSRTIRTGRRLACLAGAAALIASGPVTSASAAQPAASERGGAADQCVGDSSGGPVRCFDTLAQVQDFVDGANRETRSSTGATGTAAAADSTVDDGTVIIGRLYENPNFSGWSYTLTGGHPCVDTATEDWVADSLPDYVTGASSVQAWADCEIYLFTEPDQQGAKDGRYRGNVSDIGPIVGDQVRSASFY